MTHTTVRPPARPEPKNWTIAYRNPRANRFLRVDLSLTWDEARKLAGRVVEAEPGLQVYYVSTRQAELDGYVVKEDQGNILMETGRRVQIREGGVLPEGVTA